VSIYLNSRPATFHVDGHHVEAARPVVQAMPGQIVYGHLGQPLLLPRRQGLGGGAKLLADTGLHLDEHGHALVRGDDVNFSKPGSVAAIKNCVPQSLEFGAREIFTVFSKDLSGIV